MSRTYKDKRKNVWSVPSDYKKQRRRSRRARAKQAVREDQDIPVEKQNDSYDYW